MGIEEMFLKLPDSVTKTSKGQMVGAALINAKKNLEEFFKANPDLTAQQRADLYANFQTNGTDLVKHHMTEHTNSSNAAKAQKLETKPNWNH